MRKSAKFLIIEEFLALLGETRDRAELYDALSLLPKRDMEVVARAVRARISQTEEVRDALRARLAEVEAQAAAMREVLQDALPAEESGWWCPTCKCTVPDLEITFEGYHDACGTYLDTINSDAWRGRAKAALSSPAGRETAERLRLLEELAEAATEFVEGCDVVFAECCTRTCYEASECRGDRLRAAVEALKGGDADAGSQA